MRFMRLSRLDWALTIALGVILALAVEAAAGGRVGFAFYVGAPALLLLVSIFFTSRRRARGLGPSLGGAITAAAILAVVGLTAFVFGLVRIVEGGNGVVGLVSSIIGGIGLAIMGIVRLLWLGAEVASRRRGPS
jgi:hypothetical protein